MDRNLTKVYDPKQGVLTIEKLQEAMDLAQQQGMKTDEIFLPPNLAIDFDAIFSNRPPVKVGDYVIDESDIVTEIVRKEQAFYYGQALDGSKRTYTYQRKHITKVPKGNPETIRILYGKSKSR